MYFFSWHFHKNLFPGSLDLWDLSLFPVNSTASRGNANQTIDLANEDRPLGYVWINQHIIQAFVNTSTIFTANGWLKSFEWLIYPPTYLSYHHPYNDPASGQ